MSLYAAVLLVTGALLLGGLAWGAVVHHQDRAPNPAEDGGGGAAAGRALEVDGTTLNLQFSRLGDRDEVPEADQIAKATETGDFHQILAGITVMALYIVGLNRLLWRRLYHLAESRYTL